MKIALIDDHLLILDSLKSLINKELPNSKISTFSVAMEFLEAYQTDTFDLIITDIEMPEINGTELIVKIRYKNPFQKILVLSMHKNKILLQSLIELKINGFLSKINSANELMDAIHTIDLGDLYISTEIDEIINPTINEKENQLTKREIQIVQCIAQGSSNKDISDQLFISENTVKTHRKNILQKLDVSNSHELVKYAIENKIS